MKLKVIDIVGSNSYYFRLPKWDRLRHSLYINNKEVDPVVLEIGFTFSKDDSVGYMPSSKILKHYERNGEVLSIEQYNSMPTYYDSDTPDDEVLVCINNKKKLEGYKPVYEEPSIQPCEIEVIGSTQRTGSDFIRPSISNNSSECVYLLDVNEVTLDEYDKLRHKYSHTATFKVPDRHYLRFVQVNKKFPFDDRYPFTERNNPLIFENLDDAKKEEESIREKVRQSVRNCIGKLSDEKRVSIISYLKNTKRAKSKKAMADMIDILIEDLTEFKSDFNL